MLRFNSSLGTRLSEERNEEPEEEEDDSEKDEWMEVGAIMPKNTTIYQQLIDKNHDWSKSREKYSTEQLMAMTYWITKQKEYSMENLEEEIELPDVNSEQLNRFQLFTYKIIEEFKNINKQLLMILLGTAGTGKSFTVAALTKLYLGILKRACPTAKAAFLIKGILLKYTR